jgi:L-amino acid N-acyltransferase YncA
MQAELDKELLHYPLNPEFRFIKPSLEELSRLREGKDLPREFYYDKIHGVKTCYLALHEEEIAHICWLYSKGDYNRFFVLSDSVVELNYATSMPKFIGRGLLSQVLAYAFRDLKREGYKKVVVLIHEKNIPSIKSFTRIGYREISRIKTIGPFNRKIRV